RALQRQGPDGILGEAALELDVAEEELFQVLLEEAGELIRGLIGREGAADGLVGIEEEALAEGIQLLLLCGLGLALVGASGGGLAHAAVDEDVRLGFLAGLGGAFLE